MMRKQFSDPVLSKPLPSSRIPWLVILALLASIWFGIRFFFGAPNKLLGGPPPKNEYVKFLQKSAKPAPAVPATVHPVASPSNAVQRPLPRPAQNSTRQPAPRRAIRRNVHTDAPSVRNSARSPRRNNPVSPPPAAPSGQW